jgi:hypothetical protein
LLDDPTMLEQGLTTPIDTNTEKRFGLFGVSADSPNKGGSDERRPDGEKIDVFALFFP